MITRIHVPLESLKPGTGRWLKAGLDMPMEEEGDGCFREIVPYPRMRGYTRVGVRDEGSGISIVVNTTGPSDGSAYPFFYSLSLWDARHGRPTAAFTALGAAITH